MRHGINRAYSGLRRFLDYLFAVSLGVLLLASNSAHAAFDSAGCSAIGGSPITYSNYQQSGKSKVLCRCPEPSCTNGWTGDNVMDIADPVPAPPDPNCPPGMFTFAIAVGQTSGNVIHMCAPAGDSGGDPVPPAECSYANPTTGKCETACPKGSTYKQVPTGAMACVKPDNTPPAPPPDPPVCPTGYINLSATTTPNCTAAPSDKPGLPTTPPGGKDKSAPPPTPPSSDSKTNPPVTTPNPDGGSTTSGSTESKNRDGSTTTITTTETAKADGTKQKSTSSSTGNTPDGKPGTSDSQPDDKNDLCIRHPTLNICKNSQVTAANCANTACDGDAIQCAVLRAAVMAACDRDKQVDALKTSAQHALGSSVMAGNDPMSSTLPTTANGASVAMPGSLDGSGWLGGGACFPDKSFTVQGHTVTMSFAAACGPLVAFRYALMVIALLFSFRMLSGVIFRE